MKTLQDIKEEYARGEYGTSFDQLERHAGISIYDLEQIANNWAIEVAKQTQINCAEKAKIMQWNEGYGIYYKIDKGTIVNESNIPKL